MRNDFRYMAELPGTPAEQAWVRERLEALSEWEGIVLAASVSRRLPASAEDAVNHLLSLCEGSVYLSEDNYKRLGERQLYATEKNLPDDVLEYIDLCAMGMRFAGDHPGYFVENHYVVCPPEDVMTAYQGRDSPLPEDGGWSLKLKLASAAAPEGVWLRLPDYQGLEPEGISDGEIAAAKDALRVQSLDACTLLEARCVLPEAGAVQDQYDSV